MTTPTFDKVVAAANLLQRFGVPFNTLTCVNRFNGSRPLDGEPGLNYLARG